MIDGPALAKWVSKQHKRGKHAMLLVVEDVDDQGMSVPRYQHEEVISAIKLEIPAAETICAVDLRVNDLWVSVRPLLGRIPRGMLDQPNVGVCVLK